MICSITVCVNLCNKYKEIHCLTEHQRAGYCSHNGNVSDSVVVHEVKSSYLCFPLSCSTRPLPYPQPNLCCPYLWWINWASKFAFFITVFFSILFWENVWLNFGLLLHISDNASFINSTCTQGCVECGLLVDHRCELRIMKSYVVLALVERCTTVCSMNWVENHEVSSSILSGGKNTRLFQENSIFFYFTLNINYSSPNYFLSPLRLNLGIMINVHFIYYFLRGVQSPLWTSKSEHRE